MTFAIRGSLPPKSRVASLFEEGRTRVTLLLWLVNFANLAMVYFFVSWLPSIVVSSGQGAKRALFAVALLSLSGIFGGLALALLLRFVRATRLLGAAYVISMGASIGLATRPTIGGAFFVLIAITGAAVVGSQFCLAAIANQFYPSLIRATASGFSTGAGRVGAVFAPLAGALVMSWVAVAQHALAAAAVPAVLALLAVVLLERGST